MIYEIDVGCLLQADDSIFFVHLSQVCKVWLIPGAQCQGLGESIPVHTGGVRVAAPRAARSTQTHKETLLTQATACCKVAVLILSADKKGIKYKQKVY
jgi:hypothetical protein